MAKVRSIMDESEPKPKMRPALSIEARENQLISLAVDLAEKQLREGTASAQVITHYLKLGSTRERMEKEMLAQQIEMTKAKTENLQTAKNIESLYKDAIEAMQSYRSHVPEDPDSDEEL